MNLPHPRRLPGLLISLLGLAALARADTAPAPAGGALLHPAAVIQISATPGKFDFLEIDRPRHRLLAAHEKAGTADFIDLDTRELLARVQTGPAVHIVSDPKTGNYFISASDDKKVVVVDGTTFKIINEIPTPGELDALVFDPANRRVFVTNDEGSHVWVIDADAQKLVGTIDIPGAPEYMLYDAAADRIYLNIKATNQVLTIDPNAATVVASWSTEPAHKPHGLGFDPVTRRLFSAGNNGKLAVIDLRSGRVIAVADIATGVDQAVFDPTTRRIYCATGLKLSVVQETDDGAQFLGNVAAPATGKNVAVDLPSGEVWTTYTDGANSYAKSWRP